MVNVEPATLQDAWGEFCKHANPSLAEDALNDLWWKCVDALTGGKTQEKVTPEDWGVVKASVQTWLSKQLAF
jgi:1,2-phenylacetyl-CoA epoxidase catalytic subunit